MANDDQKAAFWQNLLRAVETEPRDAQFVRGISGIEHPVIAVGVDDARRRLLLVSGEHDSRSAAIAQQDIQRAIESIQVIMVRPIAINLGPLAQQAVNFFGGPVIAHDRFLSGLSKEPEWKEIFEKNAKYCASFGVAKLNWLAQIMQTIQQLAMVEVELKFDPTNQSTGVFRLEKLANFDPGGLDRQLGICPIPLYEFTETDVAVLQKGDDLDEVRDVLRQRDILQFFFPSSDQLALGLVDRGLKEPTQVLNELSKAPELGHPFGDSELTSNDIEIGDTIDALQEKGFLVEGEIGLDMTKGARAVRASLRFKPREGIVSKIANNISIKLDLKDLFRPPGQ